MPQPTTPPRAPRRGSNIMNLDCYFKLTQEDLLLTVCRSVGRVNCCWSSPTQSVYCCWSSPAQSVFGSGPITIFLFFPRILSVFKWPAPLLGVSRTATHWLAHTLTHTLLPSLVAGLSVRQALNYMFTILRHFHLDHHTKTARSWWR
jgi:hypothetical protein